jgi:hypothetical protein
MLADSDLPDKEQYWDEALSCAVRAYNSLPKQDATVTPWELFTGDKPNVSYLRPFGAACYVHVPKETRGAGSKALPRARAGTFIGYPHGGKGYRVLLRDEDYKILESRDVTFLPGYSTFTGSAKLAPAKPVASAKPADSSSDSGDDSDAERGGGSIAPINQGPARQAPRLHAALAPFS